MCRSKWRKAKCMLLAALLLVSCFASVPMGTVQAEEYEENSGDGFVYEENDDGTITIRGYDWDLELVNLVVPEEIDGKTVTAIDYGAFWYRDTLESVYIPASVKSIADSVISDCPNLATITVDAENTAYNSAGNCNAIIETATNTLIAGCKNTVIPSSVMSIGMCAFSGCSELAGITIPSSVMSIGMCAFSGCSGLTSITIPNSVTSICEGAFGGCSGLEIVTVDTANPVYKSAGNCNAIIETKTNTLIAGCKNTVIPNDVECIGEDAFSGCSGLTGITIPDSVWDIEWGAFSGCSGLTSITIPGSVKSIGEWAFRGCSGLTSITVDSANSVYNSTGNCDAIIETATDTLIAGCKNTVIPASVTMIADDAFAYCTGLTSITIPDRVTRIGAAAFSGCSGLTSITIPGSVGYIGQYAFNECSSLTAVTIPSGLKTIDYGLFQDCTALCSIAIPDSVTVIREFAFAGCSGLTSITIPSSVTKIEECVLQECPSTMIVYADAGSVAAAYAQEAGYTVKPIPHVHTPVTDAAVAPTCAAAGKTEGSHCATCGEVLVAQQILNAKGHTLDAGTITVNPTTTAEGEKVYSCTQCHALIRREAIAKLPAEQKPGGVQYPAVGERIMDAAGKATYAVTKAVSGSGQTGTVTFCKPARQTKTITIPDAITVNGVSYKVTAIAASACRNYGKVQKVEIGKNVKKIGAKAFSGCKKLKTLTIKTKKLTSKTVGSKAFAKTPKTMTVKAPKTKCSAYKKLLQKKGVSKKARYKKL